MTTSERIRFARKRAGLTQKQLGERAGIAEPTIRKYELGKLNPKIATLEKIATAINIPTAFLIDSFSLEDLEELLLQKDKFLEYFKDKPRRRR